MHDDDEASVNGDYCGSEIRNNACARWSDQVNVFDGVV